MPSATPLPRGPSRLALFGAEELLCATGCPVCRYVAEARDRFLGWFALEAHAEANTITRLCRSLGFCPAHTRELLVQPGAEGRMTAVYRYLLQAAAGYLAAGTPPPEPECPACEHDAEAVHRAVDTLLTGLREDGVRDRYRDADGLCLPHLRAGARLGGRRLTAWLAGEMVARLAGADGPRTLALIAGDRDPDADVRVRLRASLPPAPPRDGDVCAPCLAAALAERAALAGPQAGLCPAHLHEACCDVGGGGHGPLGPVAAQVLTLNSERLASWLDGIAEPPGLAGAALARVGRRRDPRRRADAAQCPACAAASTAAADWLEAWSAATDAAAGGPVPRLCLRHVLSLRPRDPRAADAAIRAAAAATAVILEELEEALRKRSWANRSEPRGREMSAWRRAAALVDGRVYGGGRAGPLDWRPAPWRRGVK